MTHTLIARLSRLAIVPGLAGTLVLGGCAGDQIQFEGKVFEWAGLANNGKGKKESEVKPRAPLVVPPSPILPEPGPRSAGTNPENWPTDERDVRARELAEAKGKLEKYRREGDWSGRGGIEEFDRVVNPLDRRTGVVSDSSKGFEINSDRDEASADDVENIANNVDMDKLKAERRRQAEIERQDPDNSWASKPGDPNPFKTNGPDEVENMKGGW